MAVAVLMNEIWLALFAVVMTAGQMLFKLAAADLRGQSGLALAGAALSSAALWVALATYAAATVLWIWLLTRVPLSRAYPFTALAMILVPVSASLLFGERIRPMFWLGAGLILCGIAIIQQQIVDA